jgi:hypothetical protein
MADQSAIDNPDGQSAVGNPDGQSTIGNPDRQSAIGNPDHPTIDKSTRLGNWAIESHLVADNVSD